MKIICPQCKTAYELAPVTLGSAGRTVRCARCQTQWFAEAPKAMPIGARQRPTFTPVPAWPAMATADSAEIGSPDIPVLPEGAPQLEPAAPPFTPPLPDPTLEVAPPVQLGPPADGEAIAAPVVVLADGEFPTRTPAEEAQARADIESLAARRGAKYPRPRKPAKAKWQISPIAAILAALIAIDVGLVIWRTQVVRVLPQTASLYEHLGLSVNLRDLTFKDIRTTYDEQDGVTILVVDGSIVATGRSDVDVPRLRFAIQATNGHEIYAWTALPTRTKLAPGETLPFKSRLASPPEQGRSVQVRFFNRQDVASGLR